MDPRRSSDSGNYAGAADRLALAGERLLEAVELKPGMELLDVACGTGHATIPAAREGARVTGLEPSPDLLAIARERAADAMVEIDWVEGDVRELPFEEGRFDRVVSVFGHSFWPQHERTAAELRRVCRAGGAIGIACWTGAIGRLLATVTDPGPLGWADEEHLRGLFGAPLEIERHEIEWRDRSTDDFADFMLESFAALGEPADPLRSALTAELERENLEDDGRLRFRADYLTAVVRP
ncbi:MAG: class I SAM-dependent methyltransferase [Thermoleophilaceae bacterium]